MEGLSLPRPDTQRARQMGKAGTLAPTFHLMESSLSDRCPAGRGGLPALLPAAHLLMEEAQWAPEQVLSWWTWLPPTPAGAESRTGHVFLVRQQRLSMPGLLLGQLNKRVKKDNGKSL